MRALRFAGTSLIVLSTFSVLQGQSTNELREPPVFASSQGELSLTMVAKAQSITLGSYRPTAWVYEVCPRTTASNECPAGSAKASPYGGMRLQLSPGDHLRIRLVNGLPPAPSDALYAQQMPATTLASHFQWA
ncbi:MAG TPA: hypothetical protein VGL89_03280 [Candidatus Koribacter sp.]|jgi:hypothetical protein